MTPSRSFSSQASAPGKAFILGEFAALRGAPALVAAVRRRVHVRVEPGREGGWLERFEEVDPEPRALAALLAKSEVRGDLLAAVAQQLSDAGVPLPEHVVVQSDRSELIGRARKLGLGSSAASAVALTAALAPELSPARREAVAVAAHSAFQGGRGSGYDVRTSHHGGVCLISEQDGRARVERVVLSGYSLLLATGGESVETVDVVEALGRALQTSSQASTHLDRLVSIAEQAAEDLRARGPDALIGHMTAFARAERQLGKAIGRPIVPDSLQRLVDAAPALGGACKPSGAGGDELIVMLVPAHERARARQLIEEVGYEPLAGPIDPDGLILSRP